MRGIFLEVKYEVLIISAQQLFEFDIYWELFATLESNVGRTKTKVIVLNITNAK